MSLLSNVPRIMYKDVMRLPAKFGKLPRLEAQKQYENSVKPNCRMTSKRTGKKQMKLETEPKWYGKKTRIATASHMPSHSEKQRSTVHQSKEATTMSITDFYKSKPTIKYKWLLDSINSDEKENVIAKSSNTKSLGHKPKLIHQIRGIYPEDHSMMSHVMVVPIYCTPRAVPKNAVKIKEKADKLPKTPYPQPLEKLEETVVTKPKEKTDKSEKTSIPEPLKKIEETLKKPSCLPPLSNPGAGTAIGSGSASTRNLPLPSCPKKKKKKPKKKS